MKTWVSVLGNHLGIHKTYLFKGKRSEVGEVDGGSHGRRRHSLKKRGIRVVTHRLKLVHQSAQALLAVLQLPDHAHHLPARDGAVIHCLPTKPYPELRSWDWVASVCVCVETGAGSVVGRGGEYNLNVFECVRVGGGGEGGRGDVRECHLEVRAHTHTHTHVLPNCALGKIMYGEGVGLIAFGISLVSTCKKEYVCVWDRNILPRSAQKKIPPTPPSHLCLFYFPHTSYCLLCSCLTLQ